MNPDLQNKIDDYIEYPSKDLMVLILEELSVYQVGLKPVIAINIIKNLIHLRKQLSSATEKYEHAMIELRSYDQILDEKNKEIEYLKSGVHTCHDQCQKPICVKLRDKDATIQSLKDENTAIKELLHHAKDFDKTIISLKDENGRLNKLLLRIQVRIDETNRHEDDLDMISDLVAQALTQKAEE